MSDRFELTMSDELKGQLDQISEESGQTLSEIFRRALVLYLEAHRRTANGASMLCLYDGDTGEIEGQIVGFH
jgi:metal-responsive CopG/Arc/MetJ family transcriptional regulator